MDEVITLTEADGEGYAVPEISHVELVMDGVNDTVDQIERGVAGVEALTGAQEYLQASMQAAGIVTMRQVSGNEGFLSSVGGGIKKAYEYVVKMFKSLWDFFFKRDNKKKAEEAKGAVIECKTTFTEIKSGGSTEAQTDKMISELKSSAAAAEKEEGSNSRELALLVTALVEVKDKPHAEKKKVLSESMRKFAAASNKAKKTLTWKIDRAKAAIKGTETSLEELVAYLKESGSDGSMSTQMNAALGDSKKVIAQLDSIRELKDPDAALAVLTKLVSDIDTIKAMNDHLAQQETEIKQVIGEVEKLADGSSGEDQAQARKHIETMRKILGGLQKIARFSVEFYDSCVSITKSMKQVFGV